MENWLKNLVDKTLDIMWGQWSALGAYVTTEPCTKSVVDPEALVVATCALGRNDARIFDESMDWISKNHKILKPWKLKRIAGSFGGETQRVLGAVLEYLSEESGKDLFPGVQNEMGTSMSETGKEALFRSQRSELADLEKDANPTFLKWDLLRQGPRLRGYSEAPDLSNPANLMVRLRDYYGSGTRADVMTYLLCSEGGSSNEIASKTVYDQGGVYRVLEDLVDAGIAYKYGEAKNSSYWVDRKQVARSLGLGEDLPTYFVWGNIYRALYLVVSDWMAHRRSYEDNFLAAERMRNLTNDVVRLLRKAGKPLSRVPVPDIKRQRGSEHKEKLITFLDDVLDVLAQFTVGNE